MNGSMIGTENADLPSRNLSFSSYNLVGHFTKATSLDPGMESIRVSRVMPRYQTNAKSISVRSGMREDKLMYR